MKIINKNAVDERTIEVGDLVKDEQGRICMVLDFRYGNREFDGEIKYPICLIDMETTRKVGAYTSVGYLDSKCTLLAKNEDIELHYE